jgi:hypothetical protein
MRPCANLKPSRKLEFGGTEDGVCPTGNPVAGGAAQDQEQSVAGAVGGGEILAEGEAFEFGEWAGAHVHKMAPK